MHHFPQSLVHQSQSTSSINYDWLSSSLKLAHAWRALTTEPGHVWLFSWYLKSFMLPQARISDFSVVIQNCSEEKSQKYCKTTSLQKRS